MSEYSQKDKEALLQIFHDIDKDKSGTLSKAEIDAYFKSKGISSQDAAAFFTHLDANADGKVTFEEYEQKLRFLTSKAGRSVAWKSVFEKYDTDHNGYLDKDEFKKILQENSNMTQGITDEMVKDFIKKIDGNGDGRIDYNEYIKWVTNL